MKTETKKEWLKAEAELVEIDPRDILTQSGIIDLPDIPTN